MDTMEDSKDEKVFVCTFCSEVCHSIPDMLTHQSQCQSDPQPQQQLQNQQQQQQQNQLQPVPHSLDRGDNPNICLRTTEQSFGSGGIVGTLDDHDSRDSIDFESKLEIDESGYHDEDPTNCNSSDTADPDDFIEIPALENIPKSNPIGTHMVSLLGPKIHSKQPSIQVIGKMVSLLGRSMKSTKAVTPIKAVAPIKTIISLSGVNVNHVRNCTETTVDNCEGGLDISKTAPMSSPKGDDIGAGIDTTEMPVDDNSCNGLQIKIENDADSIGAGLDTVEMAVDNNSRNDFKIKLENDADGIAAFTDTVEMAVDNSSGNDLEVKLENDSESEDISDNVDNSNLEISMFHCVPCGQVFNNETIFRIHACKGRKEPKTYPCKVCKKAFKKHSVMYAHMKIHYGSKDNVCKICSKAFLHKHQLVTHEITHSKSRPFECDTCEKSFKRAGHLEKHRLTHTDEKPFSCDRCDYRSTTPFGVQRHFKKLHTSERPFKCTLCSSAFAENYKLVAHTKKLHGPGTGEIPKSGKFQRSEVKCPYCDKTFYWRKHLSVHMQSDHAEEHNCIKNIKQEAPDDYDNNTGGDDNYRPSSSTVSHQTQGQESGDRSKCWFCEMTFSRETGLLRHMKGKHKSEYKEVKKEDGTGC